MKFKRKKNSRHRGSKTHSWGAMKKHRGAGNRGGRGNAGFGKRSDCKKPSVWGIENFYGSHGFTPIQEKEGLACNIEMLEQHYKKLIKMGIIQEEKGVATIHLQALGIEKLLGKGKPTKKWNITAQQASESAREKIQEKGGTVTVEETKQPIAEQSV